MILSRPITLVHFQLLYQLLNSARRDKSLTGEQRCKMEVVAIPRLTLEGEVNAAIEEAVRRQGYPYYGAERRCNSLHQRKGYFSLVLSSASVFARTRSDRKVLGLAQPVHSSSIPGSGKTIGGVKSPVVDAECHHAFSPLPLRLPMET